MDGACKGRRKILGMWIYSSIRTNIHIRRISKMVWRPFSCDHFTQKSYIRLHEIYLKREEGGGGVSELERISDTLKLISRHKLVGTNWAPTENIYRFFYKIILQVLPGLSIINAQIQMNHSNPPKSISGTLIILLVSDRINPKKKF